MRTQVVVCEQNTLTLASSNSPTLRGRVIPHLVRSAYSSADHIVAISQGVADDLAAVMKVPRERISVIYNPVVTPDLEWLMKSPVDHPWFLKDHPPVVLGIGRLTMQKDFPTLIRAFAQVRRKRPIRLVILGEGDDRPQLQAMAEELGIATDLWLPGFVSNPYKYMARAGVFVLSSRWEGFGNVLAESMACGTPVVATDCPSGPREILENGRWGTLVPVGSVDGLAHAIEDLLAKPGIDSRRRAMEFSVDRATDAYLELLIPGGAKRELADHSRP